MYVRIKIARARKEQVGECGAVIAHFASQTSGVLRYLDNILFFSAQQLHVCAAKENARIRHLRAKFTFIASLEILEINLLHTRAYIPHYTI